MGKKDKENIKKYEVLKGKYNLPSYKEMDDEFDISKIDDNAFNYIREVRKSIVLKISSVFNFIELLLNPSNGTMFQMLLVRGLNQDEREVLNSLFHKLGEIEIESISLDVDYDEKKEAEFIKYSFEEWQEMKPGINKIIESIKTNWKKSSVKKEKSYFG